MEVSAGPYKRLRIVNENEANFEKMFWQVKKPNGLINLQQSLLKNFKNAELLC